MSDARPVGRPRDPDRVARMLDAAWRLFLEHGVAAVRMETVAAAAQVAKSTLYAAYADRTALFEAVMLREMERIEATQGIGQGITDLPIDEALRTFGRGIMAFLASDVAIGFYGPLSADVRRRPDLSRAFWNLGPGRTRANLAALIRDGAHRGELAVDDAEEAAEALFGLWQGFSNLKLALDVGAAQERRSVGARVDRGVAAFMTLYRAR